MIIALSTYVGFGLSAYYRKRLKVFKDLVNFASKLVIDINFSKSRLKEIIQANIRSFSGEFKHILSGYLQYLNNENMQFSCGLLFKKNTFLTSEERQTIFLFFKSLGRYDAENQISEINNYMEKFKAFSLSAEKENKKYGALYVKLGLMAGILLAILLI